MVVQINEELRQLLADPESIKVLASQDTQGNIHAVAKGSITLSDDGKHIVYLELLEGSRTNKNLTASLWFNKMVSVAVIGKDGHSYQLRGTPTKSLIAGSEFETWYKKVTDRNPDNDLAAVYYIAIEEVRNESFSVRREEERRKHPLYVHLDKLVKTAE